MKSILTVFFVLMLINNLDAQEQDYDSVYLFRNCIILDAKESVQEERPDLIYKWTFGDDSEGHGKVVEHCYDSIGSYEVMLSVIDPSVASLFQGEWLFQVDITEDYLLKFGTNQADRMSISMSANLIFREGTNSNFFWDFGDNTYAVGEEVQHVYDSAGSYQIRLLAQILNDGDLVSLSKTQTISIENYEN